MASRVYDCVLFNGEFDALAIRIRELDDIVHRFVVVESDTTFSGLKKTVQFTKEHPAIQKFAARLDFVLVDDMPTTDKAWDREVWQRNAVMHGLCGASDHDLILMSDVDEIPRAECATAFTHFTRHLYEPDSWATACRYRQGIRLDRWKFCPRSLLRKRR